MIELKQDTLEISFPEVHPDAVLRIDFQRTLRIPDNDREYPLPPGLGRFPVRHVDDFAARVPERWKTHGGVMLPMFQSEAMWLDFDSPRDYPFAVKVATGKINAVTGEAYCDGLHRDPQDYVSVPEQPWLDGFCVAKGIIRQFVAMPLGAGYSAEEQLTGAAEHGGLQIVVHPLKREAYEEMSQTVQSASYMMMQPMVCESAAMEMGLAPGGRMRQEIYDDPHEFSDWDLRRRARCFVHLVNSITWHGITGSEPPTTPMTPDQYNRAGLPWFEYYDEKQKPVEGAEKLAGLKSVAQMTKAEVRDAEW